MRNIITRMMVATALLTVATLNTTARPKKASLRIVATTDVHGRFLARDFINGTTAPGSLAKVTTYVDSLRIIYGDRLILLDAGDVLQGQPIATYYNYVRTDTINIASAVSNFLRYDARTIGNHDVETGHAVYDKWAEETACPMLAANMVRNDTGEPYFKPYTVLKRGGLKVAVIGLVTTGIPSFIPEEKYSGIHFEDAVESARKWMKAVRKKEKPDVVIGLFHTGITDDATTNGLKNDATMDVARQVDGFDIILYGHDHSRHVEEVNVDGGGMVMIANPANNAMRVADCTIDIDGTDKRIKVDLADVTHCMPDKAFTEAFRSQEAEVDRYVNAKIGQFTESMSSRDCFFGSSSLTDLVHDVMLNASGADISFASPLSFDVTVKAGDCSMADMYKLYSYENDLCVLDMTGQEIHRYLEYSYGRWTNRMSSADGHLLNIKGKSDVGNERARLTVPFYNLDSAAGIDYTVDVTQPEGCRVTIYGMTDGRTFSETQHYRVAVNSYRASGGGGLLTKGAGIDKATLAKRTVWRGDRNLREYLMDYVNKNSPLRPTPHNNWRFEPQQWTGPAARRDSAIIFE